MRYDVAKLYELADNGSWNPHQQELYREINERIDRIKSYHLSEDQEAVFGILTGARKKLDYRR